MKLSICIPVKNRSNVYTPNAFLKILPNTIKSISEYPNPEELEIVICDFNSTDWPLEDWIDEYRGNVAVNIIKTNRDYSSGFGRNIAAEHSKADVLLFLDADCTITPKAISDGYNRVMDGETAFPFISFKDKKGKITKGSVKSNGTGICFISKQKYLDSDRWPEFDSWGGEDDIFFNKMYHRGKTRYPESGIIHQWHPREASHFFYRNPQLSDYNAYVKGYHHVDTRKNKNRENPIKENFEYEKLIKTIKKEHTNIISNIEIEEDKRKDSSIIIVSRFIDKPRPFIDDFENVLRCDLYKTERYETIVGTKTTHHYSLTKTKENFSIMRTVDRAVQKKDEYTIPTYFTMYFSGLVSDNASRKVTSEFIMVHWMLLFYKKVYLAGHFERLNLNGSPETYMGIQYNDRRLERIKELEYLNFLEQNNKIVLV
jgi:glycosyltransferase involved in cell wall biosynthesis